MEKDGMGRTFITRGADDKCNVFVGNNRWDDNIKMVYLMDRVRGCGLDAG